MTDAVTQLEIDQRVFELYDEYCHGGIDRREFLLRASMLVVGGLAMAQALLPRYAHAQTVSSPTLGSRLCTSTTHRPAAIRDRCEATWCSPRDRGRSRRCW